MKTQQKLFYILHNYIWISNFIGIGIGILRFMAKILAIPYQRVNKLLKERINITKIAL